MAFILIVIGLITAIYWRQRHLRDNSSSVGESHRYESSDSSFASCEEASLSSPIFDDENDDVDSAVPSPLSVLDDTHSTQRDMSSRPLSPDYSFKFDKELYKEWNWSEIYAPQPELMAYVKHIVKRYNLEPLIQFRSKVISAVWSDTDFNWTVTVDHQTADGKSETQTWVGRHLVLATGCLSCPNIVPFNGMKEFKGKIYHTAQWPKGGVDFTGQRVAVIGTGSSALQSIPIIAAQAEHLTVFQRTATYTVPAWNRKLGAHEMDEDKENMDGLRAVGMKSAFGNAVFENYLKQMKDHTPEEIEARFEKLWNDGGLFFYGAFPELLISQETSNAARAFFHKKIKAIVKDPKTAEMLCPEHPPGCKRICADTNYWDTYNRENVKLVSIKGNPLKSVGGEDGYIVLENGERVGPFDSIVTAVGFDAMTGSLDKINIVGQNGLTLKKAWSAGPVNYLGLLIHGFPNMYHIAGPGSPSVLANMIYAVEQHVEWIGDAIVKMDKEHVKSINASEEAQNLWVGHVNAVADSTLLGSCNSWYLGANVPGKPRVFMPVLGFGDYVNKCNEEKKLPTGQIKTMAVKALIWALIASISSQILQVKADTPWTSTSQNGYDLFASETNLRFQTDLPAGCAQAVHDGLNAPALACGFGLIDNIMTKTPAALTTANVDATCKAVTQGCNAAISEFLSATTMCGTHGIFSPVRGSPPDDHKTDSGNNSTEEMVAAVLQGNRANLGTTGRTVINLANLFASTWAMVCSKDPTTLQYCLIEDAAIASSAGIGSQFYYNDLNAANIHATIAKQGTRLCNRCTQARMPFAQQYADIAVLADVNIVTLALANNQGIGCTGTYTLASLDDQYGNPISNSTTSGTPPAGSRTTTAAAAAATTLTSVSTNDAAGASTASSNGPGFPTTAVAVSVVGVVALAAMVAVGVMLIRRSRNRKTSTGGVSNSNPQPPMRPMSSITAQSQPLSDAGVNRMSYQPSTFTDAESGDLGTSASLARPSLIRPEAVSTLGRGPTSSAV
ncbi:hypothetical protein SmJEL517_g01801 [Synchytrium microbalum]|uniref:FAD/NAD(P)-binding domain-containing protein n=1 Tax=Synchytrium microbalum TaxID=1806994 RepID=A0A507C301_9FUNG|nr:uncharacterized protein SmJEL517_g01801 [Synchytrium microbalum]TPX35890.1 hypothetical protein SmJEL517_g01801 [Synchytrium microbalum]